MHRIRPVSTLLLFSLNIYIFIYRYMGVCIYTNILYSGNPDTLQELCCSGLAKNLIERSRRRARNEKVSWHLLKYNRTPSTWFRGVRVISDRATQIPELPESGIRQVVLRIASRQSTASHQLIIDSNTGTHYYTPSPEKIRDCVEYVVIQKLRIKGEEKPWQVWGYTSPTTVDDLDSVFFSTQISMRERLEAMQDMMRGR